MGTMGGCPNKGREPRPGRHRPPVHHPRMHGRAGGVGRGRGEEARLGRHRRLTGTRISRGAPRGDEGESSTPAGPYRGPPHFPRLLRG